MTRPFKYIFICFMLFLNSESLAKDNNCPKSVEEKTFSLAYLITDEKPRSLSIRQCQEIEYKVNRKQLQNYYLVHLYYEIRGSTLDYLVLFYNVPNPYNGLTSTPVLASYLEVGSNSSYLIVSKFTFANNEISLIGNLPPLDFESNKERYLKLIFSPENGGLRKIREEEQ